MSTQTYSFYGTSGIIPNVPNPADPRGEFHAGQWVTVDLSTLQIVSQGYLPALFSPPQGAVDETFVEYGEAGSIPDVPNQTIDAGQMETINTTNDTVVSDQFLPSS